MGSFLSIVNNTGDEFLCSVGPDQAALGIFGVIATVISATVAVFATAGLASPAVAAAATSGVVAVTGMTAASAATVLTTAGVVTSAAGFLHLVVSETTKKIEEEGFVRIPPGERHQFGPYTLSLWQQGHCRRLRASPDEMTFIHDEVFMRPIFSGATDQSNLDHDIQFWIDKFGFEGETKVVLSPPEGQDSWGDVNAPLITSTGSSRARTLMTSDQVPFMCNLCGDNQAITIPDATVFIPDHGNYTCSELEAAGENGQISENDCPLVRGFLEPCGCSVPPTPSIAPPTRHLRHL
jgi:hypothetical protein